MTPFELTFPASFEEAVAMLEPADPAVRPIAGGTALVQMMKSGWLKPRKLVCLRGLGPQARSVERLPDGGLRIGALATLSDLERDPAVREVAPVVAWTLARLSNVRVRNVATLGGHLAHGDPHMDLPPVLAAIGARVTLVGPAGSRALPVEALHEGYLETVLAGDELVSEVRIAPQTGLRAAYCKVTTRASDDWPALGVAVSLRVDETRVREANVLVSAATERVTRLATAQDELAGSVCDEAAIGRAADAAAAEAPLVGDQHGSAAYKRELLRVYLGRAVMAALGEVRGSREAWS